MANYPMYNYQPQQMYQQMYQQPQQTEQPLFCRMATNREEVQAFPVDFSGRPMTFLGPGMQTIWVKTFNPVTGGSDVTEYTKPVMAAEKPSFATMSDLEQVLELVRKQGEEIALLKGQRRRVNKEDTEDAI